MAFDRDSVIIYDPSGGAATNGGGFAASRGGVRITSPIAYTDLVIDGATNKLSSVTRPFTIDDRGNFICITGGTGFTPSWYEILTVSSGVATCDRVIGELGSTGGTGNLGGYIDKFTDALMELSVAGLTHQVWATAAMALGEDLGIEADGNYTCPIYIEGRASDGSDNPQGASRPTIACGAYGFAVDDWWHIEDLIFTTENANGVRLDYGGLIRNCKITNSSGTAERYALVIGGSGVRVVDCELISTNGTALYASTSSGTILYANYIHDSAVGVVVGQNAQIIANIIETCSATGLDVNGFLCFVLNNTVDTCDNGIDGASDVGGSGVGGLLVLNNILSNNRNGAVWVANPRTNYWDYNNFYNNGTDRTNVDAGPHDNDVDPGYTNAAAGDFSTGANVADTGFGIRLGVG